MPTIQDQAIVQTAPQTLVFLGAIAGGSAAALINLIGGFFMRRSESKREIRRLAIESALDNWKHQNLLKMDWAKSEKDARVSLDSPDGYIIHMLRIMNIAADMKISAYDAANRVSQWSSGEVDSTGKPISKNEENEQDETRNRH